MFKKYALGLKECNAAQLQRAPQFIHEAMASIQPSAVLDRSALKLVPDIDGNDQLPDCTAVQVANSIKAFSTLLSASVSVPEENVLGLYSTVVGCPNTMDAIAQTNGAVYADIISSVVKNGLRVNDQLLCVPGVALLDNSAHQLAQAAYLTGCATIGIRLYESDMQSISTANIAMTLDEDGSGMAVLAGRHMTALFDYTNLTPGGIWHINFWGMQWPVTFRWVQSRLDESWCQIYRNLLSPSNEASYPKMQSESGFHWVL